MRIAILGRQPKICLAELESIFGAEKISPIDDIATFVDSDEILPQARLGGVIKSGKILARIDSTEPLDIFKFLTNNVENVIGDMPSGKLKLGFSIYNSDTTSQDISRRALVLKKVIRQMGRSVRIVENKTPTLSSAQVIYNKLTGGLGIEFLAIKYGSKIILAQTESVQNIDDYSKRDFARPKRDARVGMLPPKLAQIIINLAISDASPLYGQVILDPFCGTGVVLQEATMMGFDIYGSDIEKNMIKYSDQNLMWLLDQPNCPVVKPESEINNPDWRYYKLENGDATIHTWRPPPSFIACETYLGRPFSALPAPEILQKVIQDVDVIHTKFLQNIARQTQVGFRMCIAVPAWREKNNFRHLPVLEKLDDLGYTRIVFEHAEAKDLIYHREDQIVARELVVLMRK